MSTTEQTSTTATEQSTRPALVEVDPATLTVGPNVRATDAEAVAADKAFCDSIKSQGVMSPVTAYTDTEAEGCPVVVLYGQRRVLAAVHVGLDAVPVLLHPAKPTDLDALTQQWDENERRAAMSEADRARGIEQMSLLGLSAAQITKRTGTHRDRVRAVLDTKDNTTTRDGLSAGLSIEQAAALAEFDTDPDVVATLTTAAQDEDPAAFPHTLARFRQARDEAAAIAEVARPFHERGVTVLTERPAYDDPALSLARLVDAEGNDLDEAEHEASCPGHAVLVHYVRPYNDDEEPHAQAVPFCTDPKANKHRDRYSSSGSTNSGPMSEEQKAERRTLIANNKAWDAAQDVRREWLAALVTRKTPPTGGEALIARALTLPYGDDINRSDWTAPLDLDGDKIAREAHAKNTTAKRHTVLALARVLGQWERHAGRNTWRNPSPWDAVVMTALIAWGYPASDLEKGVATHKPDKR